MSPHTPTSSKAASPKTKSSKTSSISSTAPVVTTMAKSRTKSSLTTTVIYAVPAPVTTTSSTWWSRRGNAPNTTMMEQLPPLSNTSPKKCVRVFKAELRATKHSSKKYLTTSIWTRRAPSPSMRSQRWLRSLKSQLRDDLYGLSSKWSTRTTQAVLSLESSMPLLEATERGKESNKNQEHTTN